MTSSIDERTSSKTAVVAETMAAYGIPEADIARVLGVSKPTLRKRQRTSAYSVSVDLLLNH